MCALVSHSLIRLLAHFQLIRHLALGQVPVLTQRARLAVGLQLYCTLPAPPWLWAEYRS